MQYDRQVGPRVDKVAMRLVGMIYFKELQSTKLFVVSGFVLWSALVTFAFALWKSHTHAHEDGPSDKASQDVLGHCVL